MPPRAAGRKPATAGNKAPSKAETVAAIAEKAGVPKATAAAVLDALAETATADLKRHKAALIPGVAKVTAVHRPATRAREGINPFTKEPMTFKAKAARNDVKLRALKPFKDGV